MNRYNTPINRWLLAGLFILGLQACSSEDDDSLGTVAADSVETMQAAIEALPIGDLTPQEEQGILYMREEEKLARDVYLDLHELWGARVFDNIANSEQAHADAMLLLITRYQLSDPVGNNPIGVFMEPDLQELYNQLSSLGSTSLTEALKVGALIEETDVVDIERYIAMVDGNDDMILVYEHLLTGSRNHLRAFVRNLEQQGVIYEPQILDPAVFQAIIDSPTERGGDTA